MAALNMADTHEESQATVFVCLAESTHNSLQNSI